MKLFTDDELADLLRITRDDVRINCRAKGWPCVRPKRSVWRFTEEQVAEIIAITTKTSPPPLAKQVGRVPDRPR